MSKKLNIKRIILCVIIIALVIYLIVNLVLKLFKSSDSKADVYVASITTSAKLYDDQYNESIDIIRGTKITINKKKKTVYNENEYYPVSYNGKEYFILKDNVSDDISSVALEKNLYIRTSCTVYSDYERGSILGLANKGEHYEIIGYDSVDQSGLVNLYKIKYNDSEGYIYRKYVVYDEATSLLKYDTGTVHSDRGNKYGGGDAGDLDYYPVEKIKFENNKMPEKVYALYLNGSKEVISNIDKYINLAKDTKINAFVIDIKDNEAPRYASDIMKAYSKTNYERASNSVESYSSAISKLRDAGFYVIGRITVFKDKYYALDNPETAIADTRTNNPFLYSNTYWPSPYNRKVWEFNVELAKEAVSLMHFNEIQFDYVRFPDRTISYERQGLMDFKNTYGESKAQAIQRFLMYACDELHKLNVYVSADVFGESAHTYVTAYGQYWPAISNVVDVISAMPYPDHFNQYEYGFKKSVWTMPYDILNYWGKNYAAKRQSEIPTPAIARTWIQAYNVIRAQDKIAYNSPEIENEIKGLFDAGLTGGYMAWNSSSSLEKYNMQKDAYSKEY